jgi:hypothetical protein
VRSGKGDNMKKVVIEVNGKVFVNGDEYVKKQKDDIILVPKNIEITKASPRESKGILFNNKKQELYVDLDTDVYAVDSDPYLGLCYKHGELKLTKCNREDLKMGDLAFKTDISEYDSTLLSNYCLILDEKRYCYIYTDLKHCSGNVSNAVWCYWYKVEEV